jgi:hypothetical protein
MEELNKLSDEVHAVTVQINARRRAGAIADGQEAYAATVEAMGALSARLGTTPTLTLQALSDVTSLRAQVAQHVDVMAEAHRVNEFVDLPGAHALAEKCTLLLNLWETLPVSDRHLAHAAICYFVSWDDIENDLDIGGLDDDTQIMNAVLTYLGLSDSASRSRALAS